ncbi:MAG: MarR family transcriptional regulator [Gemmatimonadaceae bacterium]|jgi:DNA-binding MarR family transcriptional regulator|nr:MarR family transcriptional regulator [Gemmatimonadaceae bacterium]
MAALGYLLVESAHVVRRATAKVLAPLGVTPREFGVLDTLATDGPMTQRALGERRRVDRTSMVALIDDLEARGLVLREVDPEDRRAHAVCVTPRGRRLALEARAEVEAVEADFLAPLAPADRRTLKRALAAALRAVPTLATE